MELELRLRVEPVAATEPVLLTAEVETEGYQVGFNGALIVRRHLDADHSVEHAVAMTESLGQRFVSLLSARAGLPAVPGAITYTVGNLVVHRSPRRLMALEYEIESEPLVKEVTWALLHLPLLASPLVRKVIGHYHAALNADSPALEARGFYQFGVALEHGLAAIEAEFSDLLNVEPHVFHRWLAATDEARRGNGACTGAGLRSRLMAQKILMGMHRWAPLLRPPLVVGMQ